MMIRVCAAYGLLGAVLWPMPLLNVLQAESAAVVAFTAFFVAGWGATRSFAGDRHSVGRVLGRQMSALLIPLGMLLTAQLWAPNCTLGEGLLFYVLFPGVTVVFAVALAYLGTALPTRRPFALLVGVGLALSIGGPIYDLGFHPQFYTYNHIFGGVLGPIYDEQLAIRDGLFVFRGGTLLWAATALCAGRWLRDGRGAVGLVGGLVLLAGLYAYAGPLGMNTTAEGLRSALGGHYRTEHFDVYYDPSSLDSAAVAARAADHEAHYDRLHRRLAAEGMGDERIQSYLYPSPDVKGRLTGARTTSVAPVWLGQPQVHLLERRAEASLGHELAHVWARPYGLPLLKASWAPGLVEGWAVALEPPRPGPSAHDLIATAWAADSAGALNRRAEALADRLSPWGFWTGRGAVSYATMGSFVGYLLTAYGPERLTQVYAWGNFEAVYGRPVQQLAEEWVAFVQERQRVSSSTHAVVSRQFARPSLFETTCPHYIPPARRQLQAARRAERRQDTAQAREHLESALGHAPQFQAAHAALARLRLAGGDAPAVRRQLDTLAVRSESARLLQLRADAHALTGAADTARALYRRAVAQTPRHAPEQRVRRMLRRAVADRPEVVRVLVSGDSAHVQAQRLASFREGAAVAAWRALRWLDAHRYDAAAAAWRSGGLLPEGWSRAWRQTGRVQRWAWQAEAAARSGQTNDARRTAQAGARLARRIGADNWARAIRWWSARAP
jgi:hypothetical protein